MPRPNLVLQWKKPLIGDAVVSRVSPDSSVKLESLVAGAQGQIATVYRVPEPFIRRLLYKVRRRIGAQHTVLKLNAQGTEGPVSQAWIADQLPPPQKPTTFVAAVPGIGVSGPLTVTKAVDFAWERSRGLQMALDGSVLAALGGPPVPATAKAGAGSTLTTRGTAYGVVDPPVELRLLSFGDETGSLDGFLEEYLAAVGETFGAEAGELWEVLRAEYRDCLEEPGQFAIEAGPGRFDLAEGAAIEVDLRLEARSPGRALAAMGVFDTDRDELVTISDIVVLGADEDGSTYLAS